MDLLEDPLLAPHWVWDAERISKFNGTKFVRMFHEPWTADAFWKAQVCPCVLNLIPVLTLASQISLPMPNHYAISCIRTRPSYHRLVRRKDIQYLHGVQIFRLKFVTVKVSAVVVLLDGCLS